MENRNNFDGVRIGLALIVVFAHLLALTQKQDFKYFEYIFDSNFAVKGFFAISGFLVMKSYFSSNGVFEYAEKRFRRIYPAYLTSILLCICVASCATTLTLLDFFKSPITFKYLISNLLFLNFIQPTLPSVFERNPVQALNGALWTIKVEVMLYFCIPFILYSFKKIGAVKSAFTMTLLSIAYVYFFVYVFKGKGEEIARQFPGQLSYFVLGSLFAVNEKSLSKIKWIAVISVVILFLISDPLAKLFIDPIAFSSVVIFLSTSANKNLNFGKYGDISYGIYLYHFPIIQFLVFLGIFEQNAWLGLFSTFTITILTALVSWHLIEKPLLKRSSHYVIASQR
jgi:peptidoglycan/LPS O-acetylase OafA/YrhL